MIHIQTIVDSSAFPRNPPDLQQAVKFPAKLHKITSIQTGYNLTSNLHDFLKQFHVSRAQNKATCHEEALTLLPRLVELSFCRIELDFHYSCAELFFGLQTGATPEPVPLTLATIFYEPLS